MERLALPKFLSSKLPFQMAWKEVGRTPWEKYDAAVWLSLFRCFGRLLRFVLHDVSGIGSLQVGWLAKRCQRYQVFDLFEAAIL